MKILHFYKAISRIGLINAPHNKNQLNIGVEEAPASILTKEFLKKFPKSNITDFTFPNPEELNSNFYEVLAKSVLGFKKLINSTLRRDEIQIVIGGDHSVTFPSVLAVIERVKDISNLGYIHFDSHGDMNLNKFSPSNNFHGMYVRVLIDEFDIPQVDKLAPNKIPFENIVFIENLDMDPEEKEFFQKKAINKIGKNDILINKQKVLNLFAQFVSSFEHLHVSFDIDVLDKTQAPATGIPAKNGLLLDDVAPFLSLVAQHPSISFDITEINPRKQDAKQTVQIAQEIIKLILGPNLLEVTNIIS